MFNNLNNSSQGGAKEIDDIFSDVDQPINPPVAPIAPTAPIGNPIQPQANVSVPPVNQGSFSSQLPGNGREAYLNVQDNMPAASERGAKALKIFLILLVVAAVLAFAGYFVYAKFIQPRMQIESTINEQQSIMPSAEEQAAAQRKILEQQNVINNQVTPDISAIINATTSEEMQNTTTLEIASSSPAIIDTDSDGLSDQEEMLLGTDINKVDTDSDGLSDYEEVKTYKTNPLLTDTDEDTFLDGSEVKNGYNPNGEGKLSSTTSLQ